MRRACDLCPRMKNRLDKGALSPSQFCHACFQIDMSFSSKEVINDGVVSAAGSLDYNRTEILLWSFFAPFFGKTTERKLCDNQLHALQLPGMDGPAFGGVDTGGVDAAVA